MMLAATAVPRSLLLRNCGDLLPANGCCPECGPKDVYFDLYKQTALAVKAADPLVPVGGPATAMLAWIPEFAAWCKANGAPIDFISSHLYPTDPQLPAGRDSFMAAIANATRQAADAGLPFLLTEFNAGLGAASTPGYPLLESSFAAAFLLHQHLLAQDVANLDSASFWTFTDWGFEEGGANPTPWVDGGTKFGIMTNEGVPIDRAGFNVGVHCYLCGLILTNNEPPAGFADWKAALSSQ